MDGRSLVLFIVSLLLAMEGCKNGLVMLMLDGFGGLVPWTELSGVL